MLMLQSALCCNKTNVTRPVTDQTELQWAAGMADMYTFSVQAITFHLRSFPICCPPMYGSGRACLRPLSGMLICFSQTLWRSPDILPPCALHDSLPGAVAWGLRTAITLALADLLRHVYHAWMHLRLAASSRILHVLLKNLLEANPCWLYAMVYISVQMC